MSMVREPAVAGRFYPDDPEQLRRSVHDYSSATHAEPVDAYAIVAPHAGYMYSGAIAGETYAAVRVPSRAIVICPNHTGYGVERSIWESGEWRLPGGSVPIDSQLTARLVEHAGLEPDRLAHLREHAIEVHLPFLRERRADIAVAPIVLGGLSYEECREVGEGMARAIHDLGVPVLIVASSDMSHYIPAATARKLDHLALAHVEKLDPEGLYDTVREHRISMCGYIPTTVALIASLRLGATSARLVRYGNSGETSGDFERVVGYAGVVIS